MVERMVEEMERCRRSMREVEEMVRGWHLERRKESQVKREKAGEDGDRRCGTAERKRAEGRKEKGGQRTWKDGNVRVEMKEGKKQKEARQGRCIWDSKEADRKRDIKESEEEVGVAGKKEEDRAGGEGQDEGRRSRKEKREVEKMDGRYIRVEKSMGGKRKKEKEKREDRVGVGRRDVKGETGVIRREES